MHETTGCIRIRPALNEAERSHLAALSGAGGTLRGTPTGRGDRGVPFARMAWEVCAGGCCLTWQPSLEKDSMMLPSLRFLVDHLLAAGAKGEGRMAFEAFTFDHVLEGIVVGAGRVVEVSGNQASERLLTEPCAGGSSGRSTRGRTRPLPDNVIQFRPRRA
jgi:hypothetical protein